MIHLFAIFIILVIILYSTYENKHVMKNYNSVSKALSRENNFKFASYNISEYNNIKQFNNFDSFFELNPKTKSNDNKYPLPYNSFNSVSHTKMKN